MKAVIINLVRRGGMVHYHSQLANALAQKAEITIVVPRIVAHQFFDDKVKRLNVDTGVDGRQGLIKLLLPITWLRMWRMINNFNVDVVHITSPYIWNIFFLCLKKPLVYNVHDPIPHEGERWWVKWIEKKIRNKAEMLIVHSEAAKDRLIKHGYNRGKVQVVPHGDYAFFQRWADDVIEEEQALLFFGRIEPYKGLHVLLEAMPLVWEQHPEWRLIIAGHGQLPDSKTLGDKRIEVISRFVEDEEVAPLFQRASLVVLPYISATQSGVVPIASAFSKPTIATNVGSLHEVIDDGRTGLLIEPHSSSCLAVAICKLISNPAIRHSMGRAANTKMKNELSWTAISHRYLKLYVELLARS